MSSTDSRHRWRDQDRCAARNWPHAVTGARVALCREGKTITGHILAVEDVYLDAPGLVDVVWDNESVTSHYPGNLIFLDLHQPKEKRP